jgi:hypothetical protein
MFTKRLAMSLFVMSASVAFGSTTTNTPGAACVAASGALVNSVDGEAANLSGSTAIAVCPADRTLAPALSTKVSAVVWVVDESSAANVCCTVNSKNPDGVIVSSPQVCSSGVSSGYQMLTLAQISDGYTYSHYYVQCSVPGTSNGLISKVLTYRTIQD